MRRELGRLVGGLFGRLADRLVGRLSVPGVTREWLSQVVGLGKGLGERTAVRDGRLSVPGVDGGRAVGGGRLSVLGIA